MSNFIFNDGFNNKDSEPIIITKVQKKQPSISLYVCTGIIVIACLILVGSIIFGILNKDANTAEIKVTVGEADNVISTKSPTSTLANEGESRVEVITRIKDSVVDISTVAGSSGSGVIVGEFTDDDGESGYLVITNAHVIQGTNANMYVTSYVTLTDGTKYQTKVCGFDNQSDIAVLKIYEGTRKLICATWANEETTLQVGEDVIVIGNPLGVLGGSVTNGYLSALDREIKVDGNKMNLLQTDAAVNPGNSGGGLFNMKGELIGIVNAKIAKEEVEGIGFAIPYDDAYKAFLDLSTYGYITGRPTIGAIFGTDFYGQIVVVSADVESELSENDIIKGIKTSDMSSFKNVTASEFEEFLSNLEIGDTFQLSIIRRGAHRTLTITAYEYTK